MKRIVLIYLGLLVLMIAAMIGVTLRMLSLERNEQRQALSAESERLALWRMESQLLPLVMEESSHNYDDIEIYLAGMDSRLPHAQCYFRCDSSGKIELLWSGVTDGLAAIVSRDVRQPEFFKALGELVPGNEVLLAQNTSAPNVQEVDQDSIGNLAQQAGRSQQEFRSRVTNTANANSMFLNQSQRVTGFEWNRLVGPNPMTAFWIGDHLYLARNLGSDDRPQAEGCLLDWNELKPTLLDSIRDLLPEADLLPLAPDEPGDHQTLANLPIRLIPGNPVLGNLPVSSALKPTLIVAWSCFLLGSIALGALLIGVARLSERRAAFVSAVTHELRTPLTTFRLYSDLLANRDSLSPEKYDGYIETLKHEAERLEYLIENVLSWSRLERSAETQLIEDLDWDEFFERIESSLRDRAAQAGMALEVAEAEQESPLRFRGNRTAVERILFNLIDNACKYAKHADDKRIHLELTRDEKNVKIGIRDHGPGIVPDVRPRLFQPFTKSAKEAAGSAPGIGLGLSLSRRLARDLGGDLRLESTSSAGTTFEFSLVGVK